MGFEILDNAYQVAVALAEVGIKVDVLPTSEVRVYDWGGQPITWFEIDSVLEQSNIGSVVLATKKNTMGFTLVINP